MEMGLLCVVDSDRLDWVKIFELVMGGLWTSGLSDWEQLPIGILHQV